MGRPTRTDTSITIADDGSVTITEYDREGGLADSSTLLIENPERIDVGPVIGAYISGTLRVPAGIKRISVRMDECDRIVAERVEAEVIRFAQEA